MRFSLLRQSRDTATAFGYASGPAICPPEIDLAIEEFQILAVLEKEDGQGIFEHLVNEVEGYARSESTLEFPCDLEHEGYCFLESWPGRVPTDKGAFEFLITLTQIEPIGRRGAVYERLRY